METVCRENEARWKSECSFHFIDTAAPDYQKQVKSRLSDTDCIFCKENRIWLCPARSGSEHAPGYARKYPVVNNLKSCQLTGNLTCSQVSCQEYFRTCSPWLSAPVGKHDYSLGNLAQLHLQCCADRVPDRKRDTCLLWLRLSGWCLVWHSDVVPAYGLHVALR